MQFFAYFIGKFAQKNIQLHSKIFKADQVVNGNLENKL